MSFATHMAKYLVVSDNPPMDFYLQATTNALNAYMAELETIMTVPHLYINGTYVIPGSPPVTVPLINHPVGFWRNNHIRFTLSEVKAAMWCGNPAMSYINLFTLIGQKISLNFNRLSAMPIINGPDAPVVLNTAHFAAIGLEFFNKLQILGKALTPKMTYQYESFYIKKAIKLILPMPSALAGFCSYGGPFTGTIGGSLARAT